MLRNIRFAVAVVSLFLALCVAVTDVSLGQSWQPGVSKGNIFVYEMYAVYGFSNPDAQVQIPEFEANNTDWVRIEISEVNGSIVSQIYTLHFKNNSEQTLVGQTDIAQSSWGSSLITFRGVPICPANLNEGDMIPAVPLAITETINRTYLGSVREINHVTWSIPEEHGECFFDKQTGMLVELVREHAFVNSQTGDVVKKTDVIKIVSSNAWSAPEVSTLIVLLLLLFVVLPVGIMLYRRKQRTVKCQHGA